MLELNSLLNFSVSAADLGLDNPIVLLLLLLPIVATIVGIARHIVGVQSMGVYAPLILTYSMYALGMVNQQSAYTDINQGLRIGTIFIVVVVISAFIATRILKLSRMHYFPKISIVLSTTALALVVSIIASKMLGFSALVNANAFALLLLATVAEQVTATLFKKRAQEAILLIIETFLTSVVAYMIIAFPELQQFLINYPFAILLTFVINYFVGKYRGLRVREYIRFRDILLRDDTDAQEK